LIIDVIEFSDLCFATGQQFAGCWSRKSWRRPTGKIQSSGLLSMLHLYVRGLGARWPLAYFVYTSRLRSTRKSFSSLCDMWWNFPAG